MNMVEQTIVNIANRADKSGHMDAEDFIVCDKCGQRKQMDIAMDIGGGPKVYRMPIACKCSEEREEEYRRHKRQKEIEDMKRDNLTNRKYYDFTFSQDDERHAAISGVCRDYVRDWEQMKSSNTGILFYGDIGTGKSFLACCIANALIEKLIPAMVTSFPAILAQLQGNRDNSHVYNELKRTSLLVIDDLGVERDTSYALEQVYSVIEFRALTKMPTVFTTNLDIEDIEFPKDMAYKRIYSRIWEMCPIKLHVTGADRRIENAAVKAAQARQILGVKK